ncbi:MAG: hypothetical protein GEV09_24775, partial [Pseudonocardiaceae bacterium]|nr:hypothetical protein [Pseudonocardiaceae bacterium]
MSTAGATTLVGQRAGWVILLLLTLAGLFAMHGMAPTSAAGPHHSPAHAVAEAEAPGAAPAAAEGTDSDRHGLMAGCAAVLGALIGALLVSLAAARRHPPTLARTGPTRGPVGMTGPLPRPPPRWPVISLC